jgi:hypothetical protein
MRHLLTVTQNAASSAETLAPILICLTHRPSLTFMSLATSCCLQGGSGLGFLQRDSASSLTPGGGSASSLSEAERLAAAKSTKELLAKGISLFNTKGPLKGIESLISSGLLESNPAAVSKPQESRRPAATAVLPFLTLSFTSAVQFAWLLFLGSLISICCSLNCVGALSLRPRVLFVHIRAPCLCMFLRM